MGEIYMGSKRGLSPVIATVLLIAIALVLALIIFLLAINFVGEVLQKQGEPIENSCSLVDFSAEAFSSDNTISIVNNGNIPIYAIQVSEINLNKGTIEGKTVLKGTISKGQSETGLTLGGISFDKEAQMKITPIILGQSNSGKREHLCLDSGKVITVK